MGMKIESKLTNKKVSFKTLKVGDFFLDEDDDLCVRIDSETCLPKNTFCFLCNLLLEKYDSDLVTPVDVTITIEGYAL